MASNKHVFPLLKTPDIVQCLEMLDIKVSETDIQKPNPNTVFRLLEALASDIMDVKYGKLPGNLTQEGTVERILDETTDFPELHQDSLAMMMFFRQVSRVMRSIGVKNFSLKDLTNPEPGRLRLLLSAIINFARFREDRYILFDELSQETDHLTEQKAELNKKYNELTEKVSTIKLQRSEEEPMVQKLTLTNRELAEELKSLKHSGDSLNEEVTKMKQEKTAIADRLQNTQILLQHSKQEVNRLRTRIVRNPDELKRTIQEMNSTFQSLKATVVASERQNREIQLKIDNLNLVEQDLHFCVRLLEDCEVEYRALEDVNQKVYSEKDLLERKKSEIREFQIKEQQLKRQELAAHEKIKRLHSQLETKRDAIESKLVKYRQEWDEIGCEGAETQAQFDEFSRQVSELKSKINDLKRAYDVEITSGTTEVKRLTEDLKLYMSQVTQEMIEIDEIMLQ